MKSTIVVLFASSILSAPALAVDKAAIIEHVRESYAFPPKIEVSLGDPKPSEVPGFDVMDLTISQGSNHQDEKLYLSKNGRYYVMGGFKDLARSPDKEHMGKMDLSGSPVRGNKNAPVAVVEYTDFQCPYCQVGYQVMRGKIMKEFGPKIRWVYKSLPLKSIHPWAEAAAIGAECAHRQGTGQFWTLHDALFDNQKQITARNIDDKLVEFAQKQGLDIEKFKACYKSRDTSKAVERDIAEANELSVPGTPAFFINGRLVPAADYNVIKEDIEAALKQHGNS